MPIYMNIPGLQGESQSRGHENWFDVFSFSWGVSNPRGTGGGGGGGAGRASFSDLSIMKYGGKSSPLLMLACARGQLLPAVQLEVTVPRGENGDTVFQRYVLSDCMITSYEDAGDGSVMPTESLSLNFTKIDFTQHFFNNDGLDSTQEAFWDIRRNTGGVGGG